MVIVFRVYDAGGYAEHVLAQRITEFTVKKKLFLLPFDVKYYKAADGIREMLKEYSPGNRNNGNRTRNRREPE